MFPKFLIFVKIVLQNLGNTMIFLGNICPFLPSKIPFWETFGKHLRHILHAERAEREGQKEKASTCLPSTCLYSC